MRPVSLTSTVQDRVPERPSTPRAPGRFSGLRRHQSLAAVLAAYALCAVLLPTLAAVSISDDWTYTRSVEILLEEKRLELLDASGASAVFQILWGAPFAWVLGPMGGTRLATVVLVAIAAAALYALTRELGVRPSRSAFAAAVYLFNPLAFVLSFSFMTDPYFTALLTIAACGYVKGLGGARVLGVPLLLGSAVAGCAFTQRAHGVLIPLAVVTFLVAARRLRPDRQSGALLARALGPFAAVAGVFTAWNVFVHGTTSGQESFLGEVLRAGVDEGSLLVRRLAFIEASYLGWFLLPIALAALLCTGKLICGAPLSARVAVGVWMGALAVGLYYFWPDGRRMPFVPHFFGRHGLGPNDLVRARGYHMTEWIWDGLTIASLLASVVLFAAVSRRLIAIRKRPRDGAVLVTCLLVWQMVGVILPSVNFRSWTVAGHSAPSLDRYLLPLLPIAIALAMWSLERFRLSMRLGWLAVVASAAFAFTGTRDSLVFQQATWDMAREANSRGIDNTKLDAGFAWDAYHLYEYSASLNLPAPSGQPWWIMSFARAIDPIYTVATGPVDGYEIVLEREYSSWLHSERTVLMLLRRTE